MNWTYVLLVAIALEILLIGGQAVHELAKLRDEMRQHWPKSQDAFNQVVLPPKAPKPRKPEMPRI